MLDIDGGGSFRSNRVSWVIHRLPHLTHSRMRYRLLARGLELMTLESPPHVQVSGALGMLMVPSLGAGPRWRHEREANSRTRQWSKSCPRRP